MFWPFWMDERVSVSVVQECAALPKKFKQLINGKNGQTMTIEHANAVAYLIPYAAPTLISTWTAAGRHVPRLWECCQACR